jgi:hypothetical protein
MMDINDIKIGLIQGMIVLVPSYTIAYLTEKMVYTIPTLAAATFIAAALKPTNISKKVDEE